MLSEIFVVFSILGLAIIIYIYEWRFPGHRRQCRLMPRPEFKPFFGFALELAKLPQQDCMDYARKMTTELGPVVYVEIFGLPHVILIDPVDVEKILRHSKHITKGIEYRALRPWLCEGLLTSTGPKWYNRRKMLTPTFHFKILENYIGILNCNANLLVKKLLNVSSDPAIDINDYMSLCTLDIICETIMGTHLGSQIGEAQEYVSAIRKAGEIALKRVLSFWMYKDFIFNMSPIGRQFRKTINDLHQFTEKVIRERKEMYRHSHQNVTETGKSKYRKSFLDCLIEMQQDNPDTISDTDIREEVDTFMFEGSDTTSVAIVWTLYLLAKNPEIQKRTRNEIFSVFGDTDRDATMQDLYQLQYLEMVIKESLRLYPSVPYISRFLTSELQIQNYLIPAKTNVAVVPYLVHRNPDIYPDPEKFDPDRFLPEIAKDRHPFAYIPFSAGFRNCIGQKFAMMEEKIIISTILRKLQIIEVRSKEKLKVLPQIILRPYPKLLLSFTPLNLTDNNIQNIAKL